MVTDLFFRTHKHALNEIMLIVDHIPHENKTYMRHIRFFGTKIYFEGIGINVKYMSSVFCQIYLTFIRKIYTKYTLIIQLFAKVQFIYFDTYVTYMLRAYFSIWDSSGKIYLTNHIIHNH